MAWNSSLLSGPWPVAGGVAFVLPAAQVTPALQTYAAAVPVGVPVLAGVSCKALTFATETAAKTPLAAYWTPDLP